MRCAGALFGLCLVLVTIACDEKGTTGPDKPPSPPVFETLPVANAPAVSSEVVDGEIEVTIQFGNLRVPDSGGTTFSDSTLSFVRAELSVTDSAGVEIVECFLHEGEPTNWLSCGDDAQCFSESATVLTWELKVPIGTESCELDAKFQLTVGDDPAMRNLRWTGTIEVEADVKDERLSTRGPPTSGPAPLWSSRSIRVSPNSPPPG